MREIVLDTETTGLNPLTGDRLVEIGCIELVNHFPTGRVWHQYLNPERDMPREAFNVHGLSTEFLSDKPLFSALAEEFLDFVGDGHVVAHNASFDVSFLNHELKQHGHRSIASDRVVDTLMLARRRHPGAPCSLDELCRRYSIDNSRRTRHGALLDAELLAEVYIELIGGRQSKLMLTEISTPQGETAAVVTVRQRPVPLAPRLLAAEAEAHSAFIATLGEGAIWNNYAKDD